MNEYAMLAVQLAAGIGLAACAGLRAFLPLFAAGLASRAGWITLGDSFEWLASWPAITVFGAAVATELLADKIPVIDHALDLVQGIVKPAAGAAVMAAVLADLTPLQAAVLGILAGGSTAGLLHLAKAKLRAASTILSGGLANPVLSATEDVVAAVWALLSILAPLLMVAALAGVALLLLRLALVPSRPPP